MLCLAALSCGLQVSPADILDDVGIAPADLQRADHGPMREGPRPLLAGFALSDAHAKQMEASPGSLEGRGDFAKALTMAKGLDQVRLLVRVGRQAEASAAFTDEMVAGLSQLERAKPLERLQQACRPLEDAGSWEALGSFLALVEEKLKTPEWKAAVWSEELDVAWHRDLLPKLLADAAAKDPFKLAVLHFRLGNKRESEAAVAPLAAKADPAALLEMMEILPRSEALEAAGIALWKSADLPLPQRQQLWGLLDGLVAREEFMALFVEWIDRGGDATQLAAEIWERWIGTLQDNPARQAILEKLVQRWPDEPRFAILLGRFLVEPQPERAVGLFEKAARGPFSQIPNPDPYQWRFDNLRAVSRGVTGDTTYVALGYLGMMHRQDRIHPLLAGRKDFAELPEIDRARYLAAAGMDHEFVRTVLEADLTKPENEVLPELLVRTLKERSQDRIIPPEILAGLMKKFPELILGGSSRTARRLSQTPQDLFEIFVENKVDPVLLKESTARLMDGVRQRFPDQERTIGFWLRTVSSRAAGYQDVVPPEPVQPQAQAAEKTPEYQAQEKSLKKAVELQQVLALFPMPEIRRIGSGFPEAPGTRSRMQYTSRARSNPLAGMDRWEMGTLDQLPSVNGEMLSQVMRSLGKDHPRRVPAEILIASGSLACPDATLKGEAAASVQALMEGKKEARGTELFRYSRLMAESREPAVLLPVLEDLVKLPPTLQKSFLQTMGNLGRPFEAPSELVYQFIVNPAAAKEDGFREDGTEARLINMARTDQAGGGLGLELAEKVLDRYLASSALERGPGMGRRGFAPGRGGMDRRDGVNLQAAAKVAVEVLRKQEKLEAWRERATAKLEIFGMFDAEIQGWFSRLEGTGDPAAQPALAREKPGVNAPNPQQAMVLLREALKTQDPERVLAVFREISQGRPELIADATCLEVLGPERARAVLDAIVAAPMTGRGPEMHQAGLLHRYFLNADPALAAGLREWLAGQSGWLHRRQAGPLMAEQLVAAGDKAAAVELLLRPLIVPGERSGEPWAFPRKQANEGRRRESNRDAVLYEADLEVLAKWKLLDAAVKRAQELGDISPLEVVLLKLAANPVAKTFETEAVPLLAQMDDMLRSNLVSRWENTFKKLPNASDLMVRLLEERSYRRENDTSSMSYSIREASQYPGSSAMIGRMWQRMARELAEGKRKDEAAKDARRIVAAMVLAADDATWKNYWAWRSSDPEPIGELEDFPLHGGLEEGVQPERARQVMARSVKEIGLLGDPDQAFGWVATVLATGDLELLKELREKITGDAPEVAAFCSQTLGRPTGVFPWLEAGRLPGGEVALSWNLVTSDSGVPGQVMRDVPMAKVPAMDGKFDLEILAGKDSSKLEVLQKVPVAPNKDRLKLKVPEGVKYFALRFAESGSGRSRETTPIELQENRGLVELPAEAELLAKGMARKQENGPSGSPAYQIPLGHHGEVEIANLEWNGADSFQFDAWISGGGVLQMEFLDELGAVVETRDENPMDAFRMAWQKRGMTQQGFNIPARTARIRFGYHGTGGAEGAHYFSVSDARILRTPGPALPAGFEKMAKVPGRPMAVALSPDGEKLAVGLDDGRLAIADLKSGKVSTSREEVSLVPRDSQLAVSSLSWLGKDLYVVDKKERLRRFDTATLAPTLVRQFKNRADDPKLHLTPDGKWLLAWINGEHLLLIPSGGGASREMSLGPNDAVRPAADGIYLLREDRKWEFLKIGDFGQGQAGESAPPEISVGGERPGEVQVPRIWEGRLRLGERLAAHEQTDGKAIVSLPVSRELSFDPKDGTIYYVDSRGNIVRVKP
ncbi:hypothetical protein [Haloferula sp. BvORR071]|uniref:hypothetical protein n=1 Tax=Haloferula sp. BvORR071 TaxID=1396141 RepID=UPI00224102B5|nr:hypothetical protein [Haloferula sp. BvORR071]